MGSRRVSGSFRLDPYWWWVPLVGLLASLVVGKPADAALPQTCCAVSHVSAPSADEADLRPLRLAQNGVLDGLFSLFSSKPKVEQQPDAPVLTRKGRAGTLPYTASGGGADSVDADGYPIIVRPAPQPRRVSSGGAQTMCVRLCDGYYWPATSGTKSSTIARAEDSCEQSCQSETKLFIRPSLGADAGEMRDLSGKPYKKLKTAFLYRKAYLPECRCRPDPWSASEEMRHEEYRAAAAGTLSGAPDADAAPADGQAAAADDTLTPSEANSSDIDLATGNGEADSVPVADAQFVPQATPEPQTVSLPATAAPLPKIKKRSAKSTASLVEAASKTEAAPDAKRKRREAIGRVIR